MASSLRHLPPPPPPPRQKEATLTRQQNTNDTTTRSLSPLCSRMSYEFVWSHIYVGKYSSNTCTPQGVFYSSFICTRSRPVLLRPLLQ